MVQASKMYAIALIWVAGAFGFSEVKDSSTQKISLEVLQEKIDKIDVKVDKILNELSTNGSSTTIKRETKNWGKGWTIGAKLSLNLPGVDFGYTLKGTRGGFYGAYVGIDLKLVSYNIWDDMPSNVHLKILTGTPILMNFLSIQGFISPTYYLDRDFGGGRNSAFGAGLGGQLAFWLSPRGCITLGSKAQVSNRVEKTWDYTALKGPWTMYETGTFGITCYIK